MRFVPIMAHLQTVMLTDGWRGQDIISWKLQCDKEPSIDTSALYVQALSTQIPLKKKQKKTPYC